MPKVGTSALEKRADHRHGVFARRGRVARAIREEDAVGLERKDIVCARRRRDDGDLAAGTGEKPQNVALHAVVDGDDVMLHLALAAIARTRLPRGLVPVEALPARHQRHEVEPVHGGQGAGAGFQGVDVEQAVRVVGDDRVGHALVADECGQSARVDPAEADDAAGFQPGVEMPRRRASSTDR